MAMVPSSSHDTASATPERARQKRTLRLLAAILILAGLVVLLALQRMPPPLRILVGLTDLIGGTVLLLVVRQKFS
jgi:Na+/H+ antiporter NhaD/arsenite permease-like protein